MTTPRTKPGNYPAVLSYGFRPFFLMGALYGGLAILVWLPILSGSLQTWSLFHPVDWHVHELLFGYLVAIVTGFLLTAIPNWTGRLPVPFGRFDAAAVVVSAVALAGWTFAPGHAATGAVLVAAGLLNLARLARWAGWRARRDTLVLILHVGYLFVPAGLLAAGIGALAPDLLSPVAGIHLFGAGAIGTMTLAVMTRASLGHTGRELHADAATSLIYAAVVLAALTRFAAVVAPEFPTLLYVSAGCWTAAFLGYAARYGGMLVRPKLKPRQPNRVPA